jgi:predicted DNA-binding ribbon-helix-helix protein
MIKENGRQPLPIEEKYVFPVRSYVNEETFDKVQAIAKNKKVTISAIVRKLLEQSLEENKIRTVIRSMVVESLEEIGQQ